jgi:ABC-type nitrate/sulfonate/bicarbonate transport system ATPase subunit
VAWEGPHGPVAAIDDVDLVVEPGAFVSLVGPSGCGKSTVLRVLAGLVAPDGGSVAIDGLEVAGRPGAAAWLPQRDALLPWRRVLGNAVLGAELHGVPAAEAERQARVLLDRFGLGGTEHLWPAQLSGGMRQRVAFLRTFLTPAPVLLLDEPFGALDALTRRQMQEWLQEVLLAARDDGDARTVILVTHDVEEALLLADRVVVLSPKPGRVVADELVGFARPRATDLIADPAFVQQRAELLAALGA